MATETGQQLLLRSIDDYLGPAQNRFFSRGYQRAGYEVYNLTVIPEGAGEPGATAEANLRYPADWSQKNGTDLRPHLSTVDALVLGVQLAELHLAHAYGLSGSDRRAMRLRKVVLRGGTAPQEDLNAIQLSAALNRTAAQPAAAGGFQSAYDCTVGALRLRCEIEHPIVRRSAATVDHRSLADALGPGESRFYGEGFKLRHHTIEDVQADLELLTADAAVRFAALPDSPAPIQGIEGDYQPSVSLIDCFVVNLQLAQVLMYELDSLPRGNSGTLWMMQTVLQAPDEPEQLPAPGVRTPAHMAITAKRLLPLRGGTWRSVDLQGRLGGIELRCSFAHELPARDESGDMAQPPNNDRQEPRP